MSDIRAFLHVSTELSRNCELQQLNGLLWLRGPAKDMKSDQQVLKYLAAELRILRKRVDSLHDGRMAVNMVDDSWHCIEYQRSDVSLPCPLRLVDLIALPCCLEMPCDVSKLPQEGISSTWIASGLNANASEFSMPVPLEHESHLDVVEDEVVAPNIDQVVDHAALSVSSHVGPSVLASGGDEPVPYWTAKEVGVARP